MPPIGTDIVCAGISALYQTIVESAMENSNGTYKTSSEAGYGYIKPKGLTF
ncbi:MAG: ribosomal-processing cysteine protease Prp [Mogibacterium diversum]|nr:ribosomal-processing cysteine protease Prp [Mogibacterium diversum]